REPAMTRACAYAQRVCVAEPEALNCDVSRGTVQIEPMRTLDFDTTNCLCLDRDRVCSRADFCHGDGGHRRIQPVADDDCVPGHSGGDASVQFGNRGDLIGRWRAVQRDSKEIKRAKGTMEVK